MSSMTIDQAFELGLDHYRNGRLQAAEMLCREILKVQPRNPDALNLLGFIAYQCNQPEALRQWPIKSR